MNKTIQFEASIGDLTLVNSTVKIFQANNPAFEKIYQENTASFSINLDVLENTYYYVVLQVNTYQTPGSDNTSATNGNNISLLAVFNSTVDMVPLTPQTTIACAFAFARFINAGDKGNIILSGEEARLKICFGMMYNLIDANGGISPIIGSSPNGMETNSLAIINSFCDLICASISNTSTYSAFLQLAGNQSSFLSALIYIVHNPYTSVKDIYELMLAVPQIFAPSLKNVTMPHGGEKSRQPDQWTIAVKTNRSGSLNFLISGTASVVFDIDDKAWIANNFRQGTADSGSHCIVLNADLSPCSFSPLTGGGLLGVGFGSAISPDKKTIALGSYGWGTTDHNPQPGTLSVFNWADGKPLSPPNGYINKLSRIQGMVYDNAGNLWMASWGTQKPMAPSPPALYEAYPDQPSAAVVYIGGDPNNSIAFNAFFDVDGSVSPSPFHGTFDVAIDQNGYAFVSNAGSKAYDKGDGYDHDACPSAVYKLQLDIKNKTLTCVAHWISDYENNFEEFRQISINSKNEVYVGGVTSSRVVKLSNDLSTVIKTFSTNIDAAWGVNFDKNDIMYVANFSKGRHKVAEYKTLDMEGPFGVTIIHNDDPESAMIMTLPTGGDDVKLANGQPLYGNQTGPNGRELGKCYQPIMRLTSTNIDRAGNLWAMNNWKPSLYTDLQTQVVMG